MVKYMVFGSFSCFKHLKFIMGLPTGGVIEEVCTSAVLSLYDKHHCLTRGQPRLTWPSSDAYSAVE